MQTDLQLLIQALNCIIARKKRKLKRAERQLLMCENDYIQMLNCRNITNIISKIQQFETLKQKLEL